MWARPISMRCYFCGQVTVFGESERVLQMELSIPSLLINLSGPDLIRRTFLKRRIWSFLKRDILLLNLKKWAAMLVEDCEGMRNHRQPSTPESSWADSLQESRNLSLKSNGTQFCQQPEGAWKDPSLINKCAWSPPDCNLMSPCM